MCYQELVANDAMFRLRFTIDTATVFPNDTSLESKDMMEAKRELSRGILANEKITEELVASKKY
jgi:hypothetical protein